MRAQLLNKIEKLYELRDLDALDKLATPVTRQINKKDDYSSVLMLSCNKIKHLKKIKELKADCIILNLEDGVAKEDKPFALVLAALFLRDLKKCNKKLVVRVNALDEGGYEEIVYLNQFMPDAIRVPKIKTPQEVKNVVALVKDDIEVHLSIETSQAWYNLQSLKVDKKVKAFYLGILDLFTDMNLNQSLIQRDNQTMLYMLSHFLITSKSMGVKPISFVYQEFKKLDEFRSWLLLEKSMGYDAKGCISPTQVDLVNKIFIDEQKELARAKVIVKLFEMHKKEGITGFVDDEYGFIDEPIYKGALKVLEKMQNN